MTNSAQMAVLATALIALLGAPAPVMAQADWHNSKIDFAYVSPSAVKYQAIMEQLKEHRYLELLSEFLSPVRFPHPFHLVTDECGQMNAFYSPSRWAIILCYEWIEEMDRIAPSEPIEGITHDDVVIGETVATVLHELGHAAFDMFRVPRAGREEDAADQFMAFLALQFGRDVARTIINGEAYFWYNVDPARFVAWTNWSDTHGTVAQRFYNTLCMAYGSDPDWFKDFVDKQWLPPERAQHCAAEYQQVRAAFIKTVLPFIDRDKLDDLRTRRWLPPRTER
jgi:Putative metallopeptidase